MKFNLGAALGTALMLSLAVPAAQADSLSGAKSAPDAISTARTVSTCGVTAGNDYRYQYGYRDYGYGYYDEPGVGVYVGPGRVGVYGY